MSVTPGDVQKAENRVKQKADRQYVDTVNYLDALVSLLFRKGVLQKNDVAELERTVMSPLNEGHYFKSKRNLYDSAKTNADKADEP